ncbi:MAG: PAS domain S-box protein [Thermodesulfovibrionales bacterium]
MKKKRSKGSSPVNASKAKTGSKKKKIRSAPAKQSKKKKKVISKKTAKIKRSSGKATSKKTKAPEKRSSQSKLISKALKNAIDSVGDAIVVQGLDYRVIYENEALRNKYGVHTGELCYEVFENEKDICKNCPMVLSLKDGSTHKDERRIVNDKGVRHFEITTSPLRDESGKMIAGIKVVRDITDKKEWEESVLEVKDMLEALVEERTKELRKEIRAHKKAESERKRLSDNLQYIINSSPLAIITFDNRVRVLMWNPSAERMFGWTKDEVIGKPNPIVQDDKKDESKVLVKKALKGEHIGGVELLRKKKDGSLINVSLSTAPVKGANGKTVSTIAIFEDITLRKQAEEMMLKSQFALENIRDAVYWMGPDAHFTYVNGAACKALGFTKEELLTMTVHDIGPEFPAEAWPAHWEDLKKRGSLLIHTTHKRKDGTIFPVEIAVNFLQFGDMEFNCAYARDITDREKAEEALRDSEEKFRTVVTNSQPIIFMIDNDGKFLLSEGKMLSVLGLKPGQIVGQSAFELYKDHPTIINGINEALRGNFYKEIIDVNGIYFDIFYSPHKDSKGNVIGVIGMAVDITERVQAEDKIRKSEEKYKSIFESIQDVYAEVAVDGTIIEMSPSIEDVSGHKREDMIGRSMQEFYVYPEQRNDLVDKLSRFGMVNDHEVILRDRWGNEVPCSFSAKLIADENGTPIKTVGTMRDVTERKKAEEELLRSRAEWANAMDYFEDAIYIIDMHDKVVRANQAFYDLTGLTPEKAIGQDITSIMHPEGEAVPCPVCLARRERRDAVLAMEPNHTDNPTGRPIEVMVKMIRDDSGEPVSVLMGIHDLSQSRFIEEKMRESERRFRETLENANLIAVQLDESGKIIFANDYFLTLAGWEIFEILDKDWIDIFIPEENRNEIRELHRKNISDSMIVEQYENDILTKDKERRSISWTNSHLLDSGGKVVGITSLGVDITERKKAEEERASLEAQLRQSQKIEAVGRLAGGIAHDFNNIVSAIIANGSLLNLNLKEDDQNREYVDQILSLSERATSLTKGLLAFSRKQIIDLKPIRVNDVISSSEKILSRLIGEDIELSVKLSEDDLVIMADSVQMEQVLMNLVTNARDAMPDGGVLTIRTDSMEMDNEYIDAQGYGEPGPYAAISITDTGIGMNEETKERIFEPFFTSKDLGRGTGLGLSTIYGIVKQLNGYINVESEPGRGSSFKIYFPLTDKKVVDTEKEEYAITMESCTETILLAEDEEPVRNALKAIVETFGYSVIVAVDGEDAVDQFIKNKNDIDLLLFDVIMPKKSGKEAYEEIKKIRPDIKALFASGYTEDVINKEGVLEEGINFIYKPATPGQLFREIKRVLKS